jgi:hypothetical protein
MLSETFYSGIPRVESATSEALAESGNNGNELISNRGRSKNSNNSKKKEKETSDGNLSSTRMTSKEGDGRTEKKKYTEKEDTERKWSDHVRWISWIESNL